MKPIIIYIDSERNEIRLSRKQFEKFIQDAYQQGYDSGYAEGQKRYYWMPYWTCSGTTTTTSNPQPLTITYKTGTDPNTYINTVTGVHTQKYDGEISVDLTGEAHNTIGD